MLDKHLANEAISYVKKNKAIFIKNFADSNLFLPVKDPFSIFMAGSPGAGKTEFSTNFDPSIIEISSSVPIVRIDPDEIKKLIPQYTGKNTDCVQKAATIIADKLYDHVNAHNQNVIVDTTFGVFDKAHDNIKRALRHKRTIGIIYLHQDPIAAWKYTKIREVDEGRPIPKDFFIDTYFKAKENVNKIKELYKERVKLFVVEKDFLQKTSKIHIHADKIDYYIKSGYNKAQLVALLTKISPAC